MQKLRQGTFGTGGGVHIMRRTAAGRTELLPELRGRYQCRGGLLRFLRRSSGGRGYEIEACRGAARHICGRVRRASLLSRPCGHGHRTGGSDDRHLRHRGHLGIYRGNSDPDRRDQQGREGQAVEGIISIEARPQAIFFPPFLLARRKVAPKKGAPANILIRPARSSSVHFRNSGFALKQAEMFNPRTRSHDGNVRMGSRSTA